MDFKHIVIKNRRKKILTHLKINMQFIVKLYQLNL